MTVYSHVNIHIIISVNPHFDLKIHLFNNRPLIFLLIFRRRATLTVTVITKIKFQDRRVWRAGWHHCSDGNIDTQQLGARCEVLDDFSILDALVLKWVGVDGGFGEATEPQSQLQWAISWLLASGVFFILIPPPGPLQKDLYRHTSFHCPSFYRTSQIFLFLEVEGSWCPASSKCTRADFPTACAHFMSVCNIFIFLTIFLRFSSLLYL